MRVSVTLLAAFVSAFVPQSRPALEARFVGNMAFAITDGTVTLMSDFPYQSGYSVYMEYDAREIRSTTSSTLSLITHRHGDHWEPSLFTKTDWKVAGPADVTSGISADRIVPIEKGSARFGPIQIEAIATPHASIGHHSYVVTWHGRRLYFSGDTESAASLLAARNLDVAFVSPWQYRAASKLGRIDAKRIVIYHHQAGEQINDCRETCSVPRQGEVLRF
jgi:L-ascorbate metabolism protein UlaG (beta-lactamase superfamily)